MRNTIFAATATLALLAGAAPVLAQESTTTTTTTWSPAEGSELTQSWTTNRYAPVAAPDVQPSVGVVLPSSVTVYPLPPQMQVPDPQMYSYSVIDNRPVVVERSTRRIVHVW